MKRLLLAILAFAVIDTSLYAACRTEACKKATAWKSGYTAVVLDDDVTEERYRDVLALIKRNGGVVAIEAENVLLGWIPGSAAVQIRREQGVRAVTHAPLSRLELLSRGHGGRAALGFFNSVVTGAYEDTVEAGLSIKGEPLTNCTVPRSGRAQDTAAAGGDAAPHVVQSAGAGRTARVAPEWDGAPPHRNPDMRGRITVQVFRVDSNWQMPSIDEFSWTNERINEASNQILGGFTFWVNQATTRGIPLSFRVKFVSFYSHYTRSDPRAWVNWEPIRTDYDQHHLWINDALRWVGYGTTNPTRAAVLNNNEAYNVAMLNDYNGPYDRSFTVYVVYNPADHGAPAEFPWDGVGANVTRAYALWDGPYTVMMWNSNGWGPQNINVVLTHETAHIFWACDEYAGGCRSCSNCVDSGPRTPESHPWIQNGNCQSNVATSAACSNVQCVMRDNSHALCSHTPMQIGW